MGGNVRHTLGSGDSSVVRVSGHLVERSRVRVPAGAAGEFFSLGQLSVLTLISVPVRPPPPPPLYPPVSAAFCQNCRRQVTAKHAYTLRVWLCMK